MPATAAILDFRLEWLKLFFIYIQAALENSGFSNAKNVNSNLIKQR